MKKMKSELNQQLKTNAIRVLVSTVLASSAVEASSLGFTPDFVSPFLYTGSGNYAVWGLQGIKGDFLISQQPVDARPSTFIVTGTSSVNGVVYQGPINHGFTSTCPPTSTSSTTTTTPPCTTSSPPPSAGSGTGTWTVLNVPGAASTSIYGPEVLGNNTYNLVGTFTCPPSGSTSTTAAPSQCSTGANTYSFFYSGPITTNPSMGNFIQVQARQYPSLKLADATILHSVSGGLAVGNYNSINGPMGNAFVFDPVTGKQTNLVFPDAEKSYSVYGIWYNGGTSYTVAGGVSGGLIDKKSGQPVTLGYLMDYDRASGQSSNYQAYQYKPVGAAKRYFNHDGVITHFEGIWSNGQGLYKLPASITSFTGGVSAAFVAQVVRRPNGKFSTSANWKQITLPGSSFMTNDSLFGDTSIGIVSYPPSAGNQSSVSSNFAVTPIKQ